MWGQIQAVGESDWQPLLDKSGEPVPGQETHRTSFCMVDYEKAFTLVIQRKACQHQTELFDANPEGEDEINLGDYIYRAIATNRDSLSDSELIHLSTCQDIVRNHTLAGLFDRSEGCEDGSPVVDQMQGAPQGSTGGSH